MDKRKSILNVSISVFFKMITMVSAIVVRRYLIQICGNDINGLNSLYLSIIDFLAVAELGVGSAITFCMYKPIVEGDINKVSALYQLFRRMYLIIGGVIFLAGLIITPFITFFAKDYAQIDVNFYLTFILMLISVDITYLFGAKTALINAYKNNYITTTISSVGIIFQYVLQITALFVTGSFVWFLVARIISAIAQWLATEFISRKKYSLIMTQKQNLDSDTKKELGKNIKAMFMHKIGHRLVNTADSVIISMFVGVVALGEYANYLSLLTSITGVLKLVFTSLTSVLGHLYVEESKDNTRKYCEAFHLLNFIIGVVFFLGYYSIIDNLIAILFSTDLVVAKSISFVITLNGFVQFMRESCLVFRDATGTFYNDRWKPLIEGTVNIILSVLLVNLIGVTGVIVATIITNLLICHIIEPYVLYKNAFLVFPKEYFIKNYSMIFLFFVVQLILNFCLQSFESQWLELLVNGCISVIVSIVTCALVMIFNKDSCKRILKIIRRR